MFMKSITSDLVHVALLTGHAITIPPEGREVPDAFVADALKTGQVTAVEQAREAKPKQEMAQKQSETTAPALDPAEKNELLKKIIKDALNSGDDSIFVASGNTIDARKLAGLAGVPVSAAERDLAWSELAVEAEQPA